MLTQIVRPLVQTQIRLLANSAATKMTLVETIARWLSYLGVSAQIKQLEPVSEQIQLCITVGKPESCDRGDWNKILHNLTQDDHLKGKKETAIAGINPEQQRKLARLIAYLIQVGDESSPAKWETIEPQLQQLNLNQEIVSELKSALKVQQSRERLMEKFDPDLAAIALPIMVKIALLDNVINPAENQTIIALLSMINK